jgi:conjugal transfer pilus assembly protein TraF
MNRKCALLLIMMTLLLQVFAAWGIDVDEPGVSYFTDKQRGWFWYEVQPEPVVKRKPQPPKPAPSLPVIAETPPKPITPV